MGTVASQITSLTIVYSTFYSGTDQQKTSKLRVTGLCEVTDEFPVQKASNTENVSIWWRHHVYFVPELQFSVSLMQFHEQCHPAITTDTNIRPCKQMTCHIKYAHRFLVYLFCCSSNHRSFYELCDLFFTCFMVISLAVSMKDMKDVIKWKHFPRY